MISLLILEVLQPHTADDISQVFLFVTSSQNAENAYIPTDATFLFHIVKMFFLV